MPSEFPHRPVRHGSGDDFLRYGLAIGVAQKRYLFRPCNTAVAAIVGWIERGLQARKLTALRRTYLRASLAGLFAHSPPEFILVHTNNILTCLMHLTIVEFNVIHCSCAKWEFCSRTTGESDCLSQAWLRRVMASQGQPFL